MCGCGDLVKPNYIRKQLPHDKFTNWTKDGNIIGIEGYGYNNNGVFNTLRCGFRWAVNNFHKSKNIL